ncbi:hypothetical protein L288_09380 [Sphingobium quisquiliarum P25]|uniref:Uncharacterized protein n=1 Tax=Sphingobium quisquiliarum P25 TaxID=1329909 RepID=T0GV33_9SPHN|nr:hypothetical protein [Sphingobium quisquiliarum]EQB07811.1 hypothetical protein L288_09380 [Sphingobium quisquiliarum P25]
MLKLLVQSEPAQDFVRTMGTAVGRKTFLGDHARHPAVMNFVTASHTAMEAAVEKLKRLADDPTRSEPEKHDAARTLANRLIATLESSHGSMIGTATKMVREASEAVELQFAPNPIRAGLESEIRIWVREEAKAGNVAAIRKRLEQNPEVAAVIYHSPDFLLGLAEEVHANFKTDAVEKHAPTQYKAIEESLAIEKMAEHYPMVIKSVRMSFFNNAIADKAKLRVEV